jgi:tRNA-splicing ligase RtcB
LRASPPFPIGTDVDRRWTVTSTNRAQEASAQRQSTVEDVWFDHRLRERLREEAPAAYKDIGAVMRAQRDLTRIVRKLEPVLVYKGG